MEQKTLTDQTPGLLRLPDELLGAVVSYIGAADTLWFGAACKRTYSVTCEPAIWRRHCVETWRYWNPEHGLQGKLDMPPAEVDWQQLFNRRACTDHRAMQIFDDLLLTQQSRFQKMHTVAQMSDGDGDVQDLMIRLRDETPDSAEDVLARRYHAQRVLGVIRRGHALDVWTRLKDEDDAEMPVRLEEALGAFDLSVLLGDEPDLAHISSELDRLAARIMTEHEEFESLTIRQKAIELVRFLRSDNLVGLSDGEEYHALRNNFIGIVLFADDHSSLPLQSVAIYCAIAQRIGLNAQPSNYPGHVHAVIQAPDGQTLDGGQTETAPGTAMEQMHLDPWRSSDELPADQLHLRLSQMGVPWDQQARHMGTTTTLEITRRTARNIGISVEQARRRRGPGARDTLPDTDAALYGMLWCTLILGDDDLDHNNLQLRRQCLPYLFELYQTHFPEDLGLIDRIPPIFENHPDYYVLLQLGEKRRKIDSEKKAPSARGADAVTVRYKIGNHFRHKRYHYEGFIVGWDPRCNAEPQWIEQMRVDDLPRGREQPFYNIVAEDKSIRYVAEENIESSPAEPSTALMQLAGRYFKRWDKETSKFESNIRDEYPDD
ncbi:Hemimethylated DNA-binding protein YccV like-domain-containing protein [Xylariales sp. AK1849]|nr:Hemimethylated DNA-binding protein YccV like-domain-containing protein [Xylariales sp. AK1849]